MRLLHYLASFCMCSAFIGCVGSNDGITTPSSISVVSSSSSSSVSSSIRLSSSSSLINRPSSSASLSVVSSVARSVSSVSVSSAIIGAVSSSSSSIPVRKITATEVVWAINVGGENYTASDGQVYLADQYFYTGGMIAQTSDPISGTSDDTLYQSERWGRYSYELPMANGSVDVILKFNEQFHTNPNRRRINVAFEGDETVSGLDLVQSAGHDTSYDHVIENVEVNDGALSIELSASSDQATLSGIFVARTISVVEDHLSPVDVGAIVGSETGSGGNLGGSSSSSGADGMVDSEGRDIYEQKCLECHGPTGLGIGAIPKIKAENFTQDILSRFVDTRMPDGRGPSSGIDHTPADCQGDCAQKVAAYILSGFPSSGGSGDEHIDLDFAGCSQSESVPGARAFRQLTRYEYENSVRDLFNVDLSSLTTNFPQESRVHGFTNNADTASVSSRHLDEFYAAAVRIANAVTTGDAFNVITGVNGINCSAGLLCLNQFIDIFGKKIFRKPLSQQEKDDYLPIFRHGVVDFDDDASFRRSIRQGITAMLMSSRFIYRFELGVAENTVYRLDDYEMASLLSYTFTGSTPDQVLLIRAENGRLRTKRDFMREATRLLETEKGKAHMGYFAAMWWTADLELIGSKNDMLYPAYSSAVIQSMVSELQHFFIEVAFNSTGKFPELYTADFTMLDATLSSYYGLGTSGGNEFERVNVSNRGGILTLGAIIARNANTEESSPVKRGIFVREQLLCDELPAIPRDVNIAAPDLDPSKPVRERFEAHSVNAVCWNCHQFIDDIGYALENFDAAAQYRNDENGLAIRTGGIVRAVDQQDLEHAIADRHDLANLMANADSTKSCMTTQYYRFVTGYSERQEDRCAMNNLNKTFSDNDFDIKSLLLGITQLDSFSLRN